MDGTRTTHASTIGRSVGWLGSTVMTGNFSLANEKIKNETRKKKIGAMSKLLLGSASELNESGKIKKKK